MFIHNIDPVLLSVGPFEIHYYGLFFVLGFVLAYFIINYLAKRKELPLSKDDIADLILYVIVGVVLGARIFYVFVYNLPFYLNNPSQIIAIWNGGLSFHGGLIGAVIVALIFCKKKEDSFLRACGYCGCSSCFRPCFRQVRKLYEWGVVWQDYKCAMGNEISGCRGLQASEPVICIIQGLSDILYFMGN